VTRNVIFLENIFPYSLSLPSDNSISSIDDSHNCDINMYDFPALPVSHATDLTTDPVTSIVSDNAEIIDLYLRTSHRVKNRPRYLDQYYCGAASTSCSTFSTPYPMHSFLSYDNCSSFHTTFCHNISAQAEPFSFKEAAQHDCWKHAMDAELHALDRNLTWTLVPPPSNIKPIGCRWVYKLKHKPDGTVDRFKARLVAKGFTQTDGIDYFKTFSPIVKLTTIRILLALASASDWFIHQLDVNNAFLHGDLHEEIYMKPPPGLSLPQPNLVCKLNKSLYGLKQASRNWNQKLTSELLLLGYTQSSSDHSLFVKKFAYAITALLVYDDDVVLTSNNIVEINVVKAHLHSRFHIKDLGPIKYFLGLEVSRSLDGLVLNQRKYRLDLI